MFRLAHISDVHLSPMPPVSWPQLLGKRITGYLNWKLNRSHAIGADYLTPLLDHMRASMPDHVAVTGDLVNLALPFEFIRAREFLDKLDTPDRLSVICGNHDAYVPGALKKAILSWEPFMGEPENPLTSSRDFPYLRKREGIAIIGCNSAEATAPFRATGFFRRNQAERLSRLLDETRGHCRVVMIHHPPVKITKSHKRLIGIERFQKVIADHGAELVLHGHTHLADHNSIPGPNGPVPVLGVPAAGNNLGNLRPAGRYNLFEISSGKTGWSIDWKAFGASPQDGVIKQLETAQFC